MAAKRAALKAITARLIRQGAKKKAIPARIAPMLATRTEKVFNDPDYLYEVKWDGYRILAYKNGTSVKLLTRKFQQYTAIYGSIARAVGKLPHSFVIDGEVIMRDAHGKPSFDDLQKVGSLGDSGLVYCVFDLLWLNGYSLEDVPLEHRKRALESLIGAASPRLVYSAHIAGEGRALFAEMQKKMMEGIVAKQRDSLYHPGERSAQWLKIQTRKRQEFVIGGWTESGSGRPFRSLIFGYYRDGKLRYFGHSGGGYTDKAAAAIKKKLDRIATKKNPFADEVESSTPAHWVKPVLVGEFEYATTTSSGKIRKPAIFKGLRSDKAAADVTLEASPAQGSLSGKKKSTASLINEDSNWPELRDSLQKGSRNLLEVDGHEIELNNIERVLWSQDGVTKAALIKYYIEMSDAMLPYLQDRPLSLHIKHNGPQAPGMYIKGMEARQPSFAQTFVTARKHLKAGKSEKIDYLLCNNKATLVWLINLGCIDVNPWNSRTGQPLRPDYLVIDLDPTGGLFAEAAEVACATEKVLDALRLRAFPKTSGKTGIHIFVPVEPVFSFRQARTLAGRLCELVHQLVPGISTLEDLIARRQDKVFIDDNQNDEADTVAAVYSVRPAAQPSVSTPLEWKELRKKIDPSDFNIENSLSRLRKKGDLFSDLFNAKIRAANTAVLRNML